jgi:hypothetical protein
MLDAQVVIADVAWGVATKIDVLAQEAGAQPRLFIIEVKTTLQTHAEHLRTYHAVKNGCPRMQGALAHEPNCEYTHHQLQLILMLLILERTAGLQRRPTGAIFLAVKGGKVCTYPVDARLMDRVQAIMQGTLPTPPSIPGVLPVFLEYVRAAPSSYHTELLTVLAQPQASVSTVVRALAERLRAWFAVHHPGITPQFSVDLGRIPIRKRVPAQSLGLTADVWIPASPPTLYVLRLDLNAITLKGSLQTPLPRLHRLPHGAPATRLNAWLLAVGARAAVHPEAVAKLVVVSATELVVRPLPANIRALFA